MGAVKPRSKWNLAGGQTIVAIITINSVKRLDLKVGKEAYAMIKASSVMVARGLNFYFRLIKKRVKSRNPRSDQSHWFFLP
jgi:molybdopterin-binding protein